MITKNLINKYFDISLDDFSLSLSRKLAKKGIFTLLQLLLCSPSKLVTQFNVDYSTVREIQKTLAKKGFQLASENGTSTSMNTSIFDLGFSIRTINRLKGNNILYLSDLANKTEEELLSIKNFGRTCLKEVKQALETNFSSENFREQPCIAVDGKIPINALGFSVRTNNCLRKVNIMYLDDLTQKTSTELMEIKNFGKSCLTEVRSKLSALDASLKDEIRSANLLREVDAYKTVAEAGNLNNALENIDSNITFGQLIALPDKELEALGLTAQKCYLLSTNSKQKYLVLIKNKISQKNEKTTEDANSKSTYELKLEEIFALNELSVSEGLKPSLDSLEEKNKRDRQILTERLKGRTLEEIGKRFGLTRERVRQIEARAINRFNCILNSHIYKLVLKREISNNNGLLDLQQNVNFLPKINTETDRKVIKVISKQYKFAKLINGTLILAALNEQQFEGAINQISDFLVKSLPALFKINVLKEFINNNQQNLFNLSSESLIELLNQFNILKKRGNIYSVQSITKSFLLALLIKEHFPSGIDLYKQAATLKKKAIEKYGNLFQDINERAITGLVNNREEIVLWDYGTYLHWDCAKTFIDKRKIKKITDWILNKFNEGMPFMSANLPFTHFKVDCTSMKITNEHALYSCLRKFSADKFFLPKTPKIFPKESREAMTVLEMVEHAFLCEKKPTSVPAVTKKFGFKDYQILQRFDLSDRLIMWDRKTYVHLENVDFNPKELNFLNDKLIEIVSKHGSSSINALFLGNKVRCIASGIPNSIALFYLLERYYANNLLVFGRYPTVYAIDRAQSTSSWNEISDFLKMQQNTILVKELEDEFITKRGYKPVTLYNALNYKDSILRATKISYIHEENLNLSKENIKQLNQVVMDLYNINRNRGEPFVNINQLLPKAITQGVDFGIPLHAELILSLVTRLPELDYKIIGTMRTVLLPNKNKEGLQDEVDLVKYLLKKHFNAAAGLQVFEKYLADKGIRKTITAFTRGLSTGLSTNGHEVWLDGA